MSEPVPKDWCGSVYNKETRELFKAAMEAADLYGRVVVYPVNDFPPMHLGVVGGKLCASTDLFQDFAHNLTNIAIDQN